VHDDSQAQHKEEVFMLHEPIIETGTDPAFVWKRRLGVIMFFIYATIYAGFTAINVISPRIMETIIFSGLNLAVVFGFGLIILALVMALVYNVACTNRERMLADGGLR
ncbi:MAG: DUF485 domain-containing protein, partial [Spirochaetota bacterium]